MESNNQIQQPSLKLLKLRRRCGSSERGMININSEEIHYLGYFDIPHAPQVGSYFINTDDNKLYRCDGYDGYGQIECKHKGCFKWFKKSVAREVVITTYGTLLTRLVFPIDIAMHIAKNNLTSIDVYFPDDINKEAILFKLNDLVYSSLTSLLYHVWYVWDKGFDKLVSFYGCLPHRHYKTDAKSIHEGQLKWSLADCNWDIQYSPFFSASNIHFRDLSYIQMFAFKYKKYEFFDRFVANPLPIDERLFNDLFIEDYNRSIKSRVANDYELAEIIWGCKTLDEVMKRLNIPADKFEFKTKSYHKRVRELMRNADKCQRESQYLLICDFFDR